MNKNEFKNLLINSNVIVNDGQVSLLFKLMDYTLKENEKFNLTAIKKEDDFLIKMILDSAIAFSSIDLNNKSIIDVGTGAGFPGLVIAILYPEANVTLLDSTKKKIDHINKFINLHNLNANAVTSRAEEYAKNHRETYDFATARAVASLPILLELIIPMIKEKGVFISLKGKNYKEEIKNSNAFKKLDASIIKEEKQTLPIIDEERVLLYIKKDKKTNIKYPREYSLISNKPL